MRIALVLIMTLGIRATEAAEAPKYPKQVRAFSELPFQRTTQRTLPAGIRVWQNQCLETTTDPNFAATVCYVDLNGDGRAEIIALSHCKKTEMFDIYQECSGRWVHIAVIWSTELNLLTRRNGYYQIEGRVVGGHGETLSRQLFTFEAPRFHIRRSDVYEHDSYVRSADPSKLEAVMEHDYKEQFAPN
jgi:hypothetical protein